MLVRMAQQLSCYMVEAQELLGALVAAAEPRELALVLDILTCA